MTKRKEKKPKLTKLERELLQALDDRSFAIDSTEDNRVTKALLSLKEKGLVEIKVGKGILSTGNKSITFAKMFRRTTLGRRAAAIVGLRGGG